MDNSYLSIVDIAGQYVRLTPKGNRHYAGRCPFCSPEENKLVLSLDKQCWRCMSCGAEGDRYDFVARSENIGRAQAILMVGHHTNSGEPFPHARFKPGSVSINVAQVPEPEQAATVPAVPSATAPQESVKVEATADSPDVPSSSAAKGLLAPFLEFQKIIPSYQGAAILDNESRMIVYDSDYPSLDDLAGIGEILGPILVHAGTAFGKLGMNGGTVPATLALSSEISSFLVHKSGPADELMLLVVRLANPSDVPVARRLVASASTKLA